MKKEKSNIFKGKWYQFQKTKFSILKEENFFLKDDHEQRVSFFKENFKKKKKSDGKVFFEGLQKNQKRKFKSRKKGEKNYTSQNSGTTKHQSFKS